VVYGVKSIDNQNHGVEVYDLVDKELLPCRVLSAEEATDDKRIRQIWIHNKDFNQHKFRPVFILKTTNSKTIRMVELQIMKFRS